MKSVWNYVKTKLSAQPVRIAGYTAVVGLFGTFVARGYLDHNTSDFLLAAITSLIGTSGTEAVTANVYPAVNVEPADPPAPGK